MVKRIVKAKVKELEIPAEEPFKNDKLERKNYAEILTGIVETFEDGAVIALNGAWGTGKTTFVRMWEQYLKNDDFPVIYYNAWEDDISEEPLFSLLRCLKNANKKEDKEGKLKKVFTVGGKILAGMAVGTVKGFLGEAGEIVSKAGEGAIDAIAKEFTDSLEKEDKIEELLGQFKTALIEYVAFVCNNGKPLVYFIDELDRCNPTFAVKALERMKHLFDIPNVVFVLSIDKRQLAYSINGYYGNENINSIEYLRRFIDIDYNLPDPDPERYCEYLYDYYGFGKFVESESRRIIIGNKVFEDKNILLAFAKLLVKFKCLSLRQTERIFALARVGLCQMTSNSKLFTDVYFFMAFLKVCEPNIFTNIRDFNYNLQELLDAIEELGKDLIQAEIIQGTNFYLCCICHLLVCYEESIRNNPERKHEPIAPKGDSSLSLNFKCFDNKTGNDILSHYHQRYNLVVDIRHFTKKLELFMPLQDE